MKQHNKKPYATLELWEQIIDWQLLLLNIFAMMSLITLKLTNGANDMIREVLINVGYSAVISIALSVFIYFKFLKKIPDENKRKIEELLNSRLNYETTNHNAVINAVNPSTAHLSKENDRLSLEHKDILSTVGIIEKTVVTHNATQEYSYKLLEDNQRLIVDSVKNLDNFSDILLELKLENANLIEKNNNLQQENARLKSQARQSVNKETEIF